MTIRACNCHATESFVRLRCRCVGHSSISIHRGYMTGWYERRNWSHKLCPNDGKVFAYALHLKYNILPVSLGKHDVKSLELAHPILIPQGSQAHDRPQYQITVVQHRAYWGLSLLRRAATKILFRQSIRFLLLEINKPLW